MILRMKFSMRIILLMATISITIVCLSMLDSGNADYNVHERKGFDVNSFRRNLLYHPLIMQPPIVRNYADNDTVKEIVRLLVAKYGFAPAVVPGTGGRATDSAWSVADAWVDARQITPDVTPELRTIIHDLSTLPIVRANFGHKGTQLKLSLLLYGGVRVAFKPQWYARDFVILGKPYAGADRHNGEIAAFHLNRVLGFRRAPIVAGRRINLKNEVMPVATSQLLKTFFTKENNTCFYGQCYYCKGPEDGVCADGHVLEGTMVLWLPSSVQLTNHKHPWARTYQDGVKARWELEANYCTFVQSLWPYRDLSAEFLDLMDGVVFDYLIGNSDRHNYETANGTATGRGMVLLIDSAKSFGNPFHDERSILAPILQCCRLRKSTYNRLMLLQNGVLGRVMKEILSGDAIAPVLFEPHYVAMDRRLATLTDVLHDCITKFDRAVVLVPDTTDR